MNSNGCCNMQAQMSIVVTWAMKAVRESINTRMNIGTIANGMIYTWSTLWSTISDAATLKRMIKEYNMATERSFSK